MADHFVDKDASGANDGSSWTDAWTSVGSITGLSAGDTVYISGGSTSKTYTPGDGLPADGIWTHTTNGTINSRITFQTGQDSGHNGTVIFDYASLVSGDVTVVRDAIVVNNREYITFSGEVSGSVKWQFKNLYDINTRTDGTAFRGDVATGLIFDYLHFENMNNGIICHSGAAAITVRNCNMVGIRGDRGVSLQGGTSSEKNLIHDNTIECYANSGNGPDGAAASNWTDIYDNVIRATQAPGGLQTSDQHVDSIQLQGNNNQILRNELISVGDAALSILSTGITSVSDITIANNIFRREDSETSATEYIRVIRDLETLNNLKILNNTFIDNTDSVAFRLRDDGNWPRTSGTGPTGSGNEFKNNVVYRVGNGTAYFSATMHISPMPATWGFDGNLWHNDLEAGARITYKGTSYTYADWVNGEGDAPGEASGGTGEPDFVSYAFKDPGNDLTPSENDTAMRDAGVDLSPTITDDFFGTARPVGAAWDKGAIEAGAAGGSPIISATPTSIDFGVAEADVDTPSDTITVENVGSGTLSGTASTAAPFSVDSPSGGNYSTESADSVTVSFNPTTEGRFTDNIDFTGGGGDTVAVEGIGYIVETGLELLAYEDGTLVSPLAVSAGSHISQPSQTNLTDGGVWVVGFNIDTEGTYRFSAVVDAPNTGSNSFWFAVDAVPSADTQVWDIVSLTSGFKTRLVTRRGSGTSTNPQFSPYETTLSTGSHYLCLIGRESNCLLRSIEVTLVSSSVPTSPGSPPIRPRNSGLILWGM